VVGIIVILMGAVMIASTTLMTKARTSSTQALLTVVSDAVEQFKREQEANPTITRARQGEVKYRDRYGLYPPDELEVFTAVGIPGGPGNDKKYSLAPGRSQIVPSPQSGGSYDSMKFYTRGLAWEDSRFEHRDLRAMVVAIETLGDTSAAILGGVQDRFRTSGPLDDEDPPKPSLFLDRPGANGKLNSDWDGEDLQIHDIVDAWGTPLAYFAQRNWDPDTKSQPEPSSNHEDWNRVSTILVRLNSGRPVIMSYGPDGQEQLTADAMGDDARASLVGDWVSQDDHQFNHDLNTDNIYADPALKEKLVGEAP
jgi:type II secretory pathway pseudopilin PulG